ncbi:MAG: hypothetical protein GY874_15770 [Desulfobacteraceae bacterium]|nr:hypothetical protein [Desulfobacteraceae bacterium]
MRRVHLHLLVMFVCNLFLSSPGCYGSTAASPKIEILITPLRFHSSENVTFLNRGVMEMLSTRLSGDSRIHVIEAAKSAANDKKALKEAEKLKADYVLTGGVTLFDKNVSTDIRLIDTKTGKIEFTFSRFGQSPGDVLRHVDELAGKTAAVLVSKAKITGKTPEKPPRKAEKNTKSAILAPSAVISPAKQPGYQQNHQDDAKIWQSRPLDFAVVSMTMADVDNDGRDELVAAGNHQIRLFSIVSGDFKDMDSKIIPNYETIYGINTGDIDKNGSPEVYVTCLDKNQRLKSMVLAVKNGKWVSLAEKQSWFFNVLQTPSGRATLIGQKQKLLSTGTASAFEIDSPSPFLPGLYELNWKKGRLEQGRRLDLPEGVNILNFTRASVLKSGNSDIVTFNSRDYLEVYSQNGRRQWRSQDMLGGKETYFKIPAETDHSKSGRFYLPHRILLSKNPENNLHEIIVVKNKDKGRRLLSRYRRYSMGEAVCLTWNNATFKSRWRTGVYNGYISDIAIGVLNEAGSKKLLLALVEKNSGALKKRQTRIIAKDLP